MLMIVLKLFEMRHERDFLLPICQYFKNCGVVKKIEPVLGTDTLKCISNTDTDTDTLKYFK